jgi:hypothetical protein
MSQNIYPSQLLNELHNHFPELLYNQRRFQHIQDVLGYIRSVAEQSPYNIGQQTYNNRQNPIRNNNTTFVPPIIPSSTPNLQPMSAGTGVYNIPINSIPQTFVTMFDEIPSTQGARVRVSNNTNTLLNTLLGGLFGDIMGTNGGININTFLNERVPVYPTNDEIENASIAFRTTRSQDDICAICQDNIENNQNVRRLVHCNHYFHQDCIDTWFRGNVHCPTCRHDIRETDQSNINERNSNNPVPENQRRMNRRQDNT